MELVLSSSGGAGDAGSPYRNEDVREWSRVDRITGMLERARVETDRWQADTQDAKQSYGKMTDSRVRNSADGSLVQKARRQVEIFQSEGNGGRNFQVVRASQWSSSRATDCALGVASSPDNNTRHVGGGGGTMNSEASFDPGRLSLWRETAVSDLDRLSYLCRKLHDEAMSSASFWPLNGVAARDLDDDGPSLGERRSNSNEDLSSLLSSGDESFARDCRTRRSLQITDNAEDKAESKGRRSRAELIAERAKRFEEGATANAVEKRSFISAKTFTPIANNDFVRNDPKHPSKFHQIAKISLKDNGQNGHHATQVIPTPAPRKLNNKTVVHLRNDNAQLHPRCINVTAIKLEKDASNGDAVENGATAHNRPMDTTTTTTTTLVNGAKPVKKVEFCKTEIHFAADSGKVNIVETDGKPPPTNKFRRRRRNHSLNSAINTNPQKSNLPVVHFGDTSYEKYIFGGGKVPPPPAVAAAAAAATIVATPPEENNKTDNSQLPTDESSNNSWDNKEVVQKIDSFTDTSLDKVMEHVGKFRGAHTTTVNFHSNSSNDDSKALTKVGEGNSRGVGGIQLQFASRRSLSPIHSSLNSNSDDEDQKVIRTTKITLHLPAPISHQPFIHNPFSNLKSVRLVMNTMTASQLLLDTFYNRPTSSEAAELWSLKLKDDEDDGAAKILDESRMIEDKPSSTSSSPPPSPGKSQLLSKDSDQVHTKVVRTHKPVVARVDEHPPAKPSRLKNQTDEEKVKSHRIDDVQAKEHCDNARDDEDDEPPVYENIFDAVSDGAPLYENFHEVVKTIPVLVVDEPEQVLRKPLAVSSRRTVVAKISSEASASNKLRSMRSITPKSEKDRSNSRSRDNSTKRRKEGKLTKDDATRSSPIKKSSSSLQERKGTPTNLVADKNTLKAKKPEVVYKTAVYNMKNEKLSKPSKSKEMKGPRLINELICGTKLKKPSDGKKIIRTALVSQSNSKKKETPSVVNR